MLCRMTFVIVQHNHIHPVHSKGEKQEKQEIEPAAQKTLTTKTSELYSCSVMSHHRNIQM